MLKVLAVISFVTLSGMAATAQEVFIENDAAVVEEPAPLPSEDPAFVRPVGPRVYGWESRPVDCGVFHYWDGTRCADAREEPPVP